MEEKPAVAHEAVDHGAQPVHHHHSHAATSRHGHGHHLLTVEDLSVSFLMYDEEAAATRAQGDSRADRGRLGRYLDAPQREVEVIRSLSLSVHEGEIVAVVGASGSGKTLLADAVLGLFESNALVRGRIWFDGRPMDAAALAAERGRGIALVPQSVASLDPLMRVGRQVEGMPRGRGAARRADAARRRARRRRVVRPLRPCRGGRAACTPTSCPAAWPGACFCAARSWTRRSSSSPTSPRPATRSAAGPGGARGFPRLCRRRAAASCSLPTTSSWRSPWPIASPSSATAPWWRRPRSPPSPRPIRLGHPFTRQLWHALPEHGFVVTTEGGPLC